MRNHVCLGEGACEECRDLCEFTRSDAEGVFFTCSRLGKRVEMHDGGTVYLCYLHREWASAMGRSA